MSTADGKLQPHRSKQHELGLSSRAQHVQPWMACLVYNLLLYWSAFSNHQAACREWQSDLSGKQFGSCLSPVNVVNTCHFHSLFHASWNNVIWRKTYCKNRRIENQRFLAKLSKILLFACDAWNLHNPQSKSIRIFYLSFASSFWTTWRHRPKNLLPWCLQRHPVRQRWTSFLKRPC